MITITMDAEAPKQIQPPVTAGCIFASHSLLLELKQKFSNQQKEDWNEFQRLSGKRELTIGKVGRFVLVDLSSGDLHGDPASIRALDVADLDAKIHLRRLQMKLPRT